MSDTDAYDVAVVGGGVAGRSAAVFTARHDMDTVVLDSGSSILQRNSHVENYPGFPAGVNSRRLLEMMGDQAERAGCTFREAEVTRVARADGSEARDGAADGRFLIETAGGDRLRAAYVIAATKNAVGYLEDLDGVELIDRGKTFVDTDDCGRTGVEGIYAAGRLAHKPHQAIVSAGHGAEVAVRLLEDDDRPFYHDWVAPERYFTGRDRQVPDGCEEIGETERRRRERASMTEMRERFERPHPDEPEQHPSVDPE